MNRDERFVHLHVHTEFSLLDGLSQIDRLMARAKELDMPSIAITDHGAMYGVVDFFRAAVANDIRPVIGMEAYLAKRGMEDRDPKLDSKPYHMLLLAKNQTGYQNLLKLASEAQLRGFYRFPRIDRDFLAAHSEGLIATTGCLASQVPQTIMDGKDDEAREMIGWYQETFGAENFYLELQYHDIDVLEDVNKWLAEYRQSGHTPVQFVATNDVHYVLAEDHDPHDTLLCIQTGSHKHDTKRMRMSDASYHLTSHEEMAHVLATQYSWLPEEMRFEALLNTAKIAAMCDVDLNTEGYHLPRFPVPEGYTEQEYLRYLVNKGRYWRYGDKADDPVYMQRMEHELNIIHTMGFDTYFLIVWDLCEFARWADIWWNVRGSGAGSMVAYCLGITNIDPIQNSLIFERFLNPGRQTMPDIDLDYPDDRRNEMIEYSARKYGSDKVAAIITFGTMGAKNAIKDVGRALGVDVNAASNLIPQEAKVKPIDTYIDTNAELRQIYQSDPAVRNAIDTAKVLQGIARHASTHAAGVIISDEPLVNYIPLHRLTRGDDETSIMQQVTQFPMETCESLGLLKVDFLGLSTLTYMRRASDLIYKHHGERWTLQNIPYRPYEGDNLTPAQERANEMLKRTFEMIGEGHTIGVFQVESPGMQQTLRGMRPWKYEHVIAAISLYRPGPMEYIPEFNDRMHEKKTFEPLHPKLGPILDETYQIIVYQEQIMQIASELFGYPMSEADLMRRAVSKKKQKELIKHKAIFLERGPENGISQEVAEKIFDDIEFFANYGFNKCLTGDTRIVDAETGAIHTIKNLFDGAVTVEKTVSLEMDTMQLVHRRVEDVIFNGVKPVYTLTTATGRTITATDNHPFYTPDGWRNLGELHPHQTIAAACVMPGADAINHVPTMHCALTPSIPQPNVFVGTAFLPSAIPPRTDDRVFWDEVVSIEYAGEQPTYDLTIEGTHNFVANDIIVHNSHAADYAMITVQTAFLKCHYPAEYMAALLSVYRETSEKVATFLEECGRLQIPIMPPSVNHSHFDFDIQQMDDGTRGIRFGMAAIKNASVNGVRHIIEVREAGGLFADLTDFCQRVDLRDVGKRTLESLIMVGALDEFADHRNQLLAAVEQMTSYSADHHHAQEIGQISMFGGDVAGLADEVVLPEIHQLKHREMLEWEKELLGFYVTDHPVDAVMRQVNPEHVVSSSELRQFDEYSRERNVAMIGLIANIRELYTKNSEAMAVVQIEDRYGTTEVVMFPRTWMQFREFVRDHEGKVVIVRGKTDERRGNMQIICDSVSTEFPMFTASGDHNYARRQQMAHAPVDEYEYDGTSLPIDFSEYDGPADAPQHTPALTHEPAAPVSNGYTHDAPRTSGYPPGFGFPTHEHEIDWESELDGDPHINGEKQVDKLRWRIHVFFERGPDDAVNARRLKRIHGAFTSFPGDDEFCVVIDVDGDLFELSFPQHGTHACPQLYESLAKIVGDANIAWEQIDDDS